MHVSPEELKAAAVEKLAELKDVETQAQRPYGYSTTGNAIAGSAGAL